MLPTGLLTAFRTGLAWLVPQIARVLAFALGPIGLLIAGVAGVLFFAKKLWDAKKAEEARHAVQIKEIAATEDRLKSQIALRMHVAARRGGVEEVKRIVQSEETRIGRKEDGKYALSEKQRMQQYSQLYTAQREATEKALITMRASELSDRRTEKEEESFNRMDTFNTEVTKNQVLQMKLEKEMAQRRSEEADAERKTDLLRATERFQQVGY